MKFQEPDPCQWCGERPYNKVLCDWPEHHRICDLCLALKESCTQPYFLRTSSWYESINNVFKKYAYPLIQGDVYLKIKLDFLECPWLFLIKKEVWAKLKHGMYGCEACLNNVLFCENCALFLKRASRSMAYRRAHVARTKQGVSLQNLGLEAKNNFDFPIPPKIYGDYMDWRSETVNGALIYPNS